MIALERIRTLYQSQRPAIDNAVLSAGLTVLAGLVLHAPVTAVYPSEWVTILLIVTFAFGVREPAWGYAAAVAIVLWPLWSLSAYLMALFLAVAVLARGLIVDYLPWVLLIVATPLLAQGYLIALAPLVAGLLAGPTEGAWTGFLAALWVKLFGGMMNLSPDILTLNEYSINGLVLADRFGDANSLETLRLLVAPFATDSTVLLLHVLQLGAWAGIGYMAGRIRSSMLAERSPWGAVVAAAVSGSIVAWMGIYVLPIWLNLAGTGIVRTTPGTHIGTLGAGICAISVYALRQTLRTPAHARRQVRVQRGWSTVVSGSDQDTSPSQSPDDDLIMIELD